MGIFYGSTTGSTGAVAQDIARELGIAEEDIHDVSALQVDALSKYDFLLLGSSTWGCGELQDDWYDFLDKMRGVRLDGRKVALFGCGDNSAYPDTFCDAVALLHEELADTGCTFVGSFPAEGTAPVESRILCEGMLLGLAVDESRPEETDGRVKAWCDLLKGE